MFRLIPREEKFFEFFDKAANNILEGAKVLVQMTDERGADFQERWKRLEELEHVGDKITHQIIRKLNRTFITPIDREDIHSLAVALDDVMDLIEASAARMNLYKIKQPTEEAGKLAQVILKSAEEIVKAVSNLERMDDVMEHCIEINRLENMADDISREAIAGLFDKGHDPMDVIKWKEIYETMEMTTDGCEDVANIVESVALKSA
jgi:predicted phosphate transport protein (TIGR00153 family)